MNCGITAEDKFPSMDSSKRISESREGNDSVQHFWDLLFGFQELIRMICGRKDIDEAPLMREIMPLVLDVARLLSQNSKRLHSDTLDKIETIFRSLRVLLSSYYYPEALTLSDEDLIDFGRRLMAEMDLVTQRLQFLPRPADLDEVLLLMEDVARETKEELQ